MTDKEKMREEFEKWAVGQGMCITPYGASYADERTHTAWITWQAAKSIPVVGEPVAYACPFHAGEAVVNGTPCMLVGERNVNDYAKERGFPLVVKPTHSITEAELERLPKADYRLQGIVRASIHAYNAAKRWEEYEPGYTEHERMAWEIGRAEVEKVKRA